MSLNLNFSKSPDYELNKRLTDEVINIYGINLKFVKVSRLGPEPTFGDFSNLLANKTDVYDLYGLPDNAENFDMTQYSYTNYGFNTFDFISVYVSTREFAEDKINLDVTKIVGNLIVLPNDKVLEITNVEFNLPHANNLFAYDDAKCVYKLSLRPYEFKQYDNLAPETLQNSSNFKDANKYLKDLANIDETLEDSKDSNFDSLDDYFIRLQQKKAEQDSEAEVKDYASTVSDVSNTDEQQSVKKPIYNTDERDIWNGF